MLQFKFIEIFINGVWYDTITTLDGDFVSACTGEIIEKSALQEILAGKLDGVTVAFQF